MTEIVLAVLAATLALAALATAPTTASDFFSHFPFSTSGLACRTFHFRADLSFFVEERGTADNARVAAGEKRGTCCSSFLPLRPRSRLSRLSRPRSTELARGRMSSNGRSLLFDSHTDTTSSFDSESESSRSIISCTRDQLDLDGEIFQFP